MLYSDRLKFFFWFGREKRRTFYVYISRFTPRHFRHPLRFIVSSGLIHDKQTERLKQM